MPGPPLLAARGPRPSDDQAARGRLGLGAAASLLLHGGLLALILLLATRPQPVEPQQPSAYALVFEDSPPDRPGDPQAPPQATAPPPEPDAPETPPPGAPVPIPLPPAVLAAPPPPAPATAPPLPDAPPLPAQTVWIAPSLLAPPETAELTARPEPPPPPRPEQRQQQASLPTPPQPARPAAPPLPGVWLPGGAVLGPSASASRPSRSSPRPTLDLTLPHQAALGRLTPEADVEIRGARVGPDWIQAFRAWVDANKRYPEAAILLNQQGTSRVEIRIAPDGLVREAKLVGPSGSVWLDAGLVNLFRNARLPAFPPGTDAENATLVLTMRYILIR